MLYVCSLICNTPQSIPAGGTYHLLRFPHAGESSDAWDMHPQHQPDGVASTYPDARSGLIWPTASGWATLVATIHWESGNYTELRDRFVRDPLNLSGGYDSTATDHRAPSPGMQCFTKMHQIFVTPDTSIGLMVGHNATTARKAVHAQLKLTIDTDVAPR